MSETKDEFAAELQAMTEAAGPFRPNAYFDPHGDCIEFIVKDIPFRRERLDRWITVYLDRDGDEIVGGLIKGIRELSKRISVGIVHNDRIKLPALVAALGAVSLRDRQDEAGIAAARDRYSELYGITDDAGVEANMACV